MCFSGIALHQIDQKAPQAGVLHFAQLTLEPLELTGVLLLVRQESLRGIQHGHAVGRTKSIFGMIGSLRNSASVLRDRASSVKIRW